MGTTTSTLLSEKQKKYIRKFYKNRSASLMAQRMNISRQAVIDYCLQENIRLRARLTLGKGKYKREKIGDGIFNFSEGGNWLI